MSFGYIDALLDTDGALGNVVGIVLAGEEDTCPVKQTGACAGCPTHERGEIGFPPVFDTAGICLVLEAVPNHLGSTVVADDGMSKASWPKTREIAVWHHEHEKRFGVITSGDRIGELAGEIVDMPGLTKIGVSLDAPREEQEGFRGEEVYDLAVEGLAAAREHGLMDEVIEVVQVLRPGKMEWLITLLPELARVGVKKVSVSSHVDFSTKGALNKPLCERTLDLRQYVSGLIHYTKEAAQLGIMVVVDDLLGVLPPDCGLIVRRKQQGVNIIRLSNAGFIEADWTAFGPLDQSIKIEQADQAPAAIDLAIKKARHLAPV